MQIGLSPKVFAAAVVGVVGWVLTYFAIPFDPKLEQALTTLAMAVAAWYANPGVVDTNPKQHESSDELLGDDVLTVIEKGA